MCLRAFILPVTHLSLFHRCASLCVSVYSPCSLTLCSLFLPSVFKGIKWSAPLLKTKPMLQVQKDERYSSGRNGWKHALLQVLRNSMIVWWITFLWLSRMSAVFFFIVQQTGGLCACCFGERLSLTDKQPTLLKHFNSTWKQSLTSLGLMKAPDCSPQESRGNANIPLWSGLIIVWE